MMLLVRDGFVSRFRLGLSDLAPPDSVSQDGDVDNLAMCQSAEFGASVTIC